MSSRSTGSAEDSPGDRSASPGPEARRLDTRGRFCPHPVIETEAAMRALAAGELLEVLADDPGVKLDLPAWCRAQGQRLIELREEGGIIRISIMKTGSIA